MGTHIKHLPRASLFNSSLWPSVMSLGFARGTEPRVAGVSGAGVSFRMESNMAAVRAAKSCMK